MKKIILSIFFLAFFFSLLAQRDTLQAGYRRFPTIPPFTLLKVDNTNLTKQHLTKNRRTLIIYFSPDCDHCRQQTDSMLNRIDKLKDVEILMATYQSFDEMKAFYKKYKLANYRNIKIGRDTKFFFPPFYKIINLPFLILYNEKGTLITTFEGITQIDKILQAFSIRS